MEHTRFDPKKLALLNDPARLLDIPPALLWERLALEDPCVLVEVGAGTGFFAMQFVPYVTQGKLYACDVSPVMVAWMEAHVCPRYPQIIALPMAEAAVPLTDGLADLVYMINLHHELDRPLALLQDCFRVLKAKGRIAVVDWKKEVASEGPPASRRCVPEEVEDQLRRAGFTQVVTYRDLAKHFLVIAGK